MDEYMDKEILLEHKNSLEYSGEVICMAENDPELFNDVYREVSEKLGMDAAIEIYRMFKGQQINFPMRLFNPAKIQQLVIREYDGTNIKQLATKYGYSEKTVRRMIKDSLAE